MKTYTKTGDQGETGLFGGERVPKDHARIVAYGAVDELNAVVGWLRAAGLDEDLDQVLEQIQHRLFDIGAELATPDAERLEGRSAAVSAEDVAHLEQSIDGWEQELKPLQNFVLPGGVEAAARAHIMRTVCRRAERDVVRLTSEAEISAAIIKFLNRLSDLAFVLARIINGRAGEVDMEWVKR